MKTHTITDWTHLQQSRINMLQQDACAHD